LARNDGRAVHPHSRGTLCPARAKATDLPDSTSKVFFAGGLDTKSESQSAGHIGWRKRKENKMQAPYVRVAEIEVDPARHVAYEAALKEEIEASIRLEPGVLALHAVCGKDNPSHVIVFEMYADEAAYRAHLETPHFRRYKAAVEGMVTSLKLTETIAIKLAAKPG
jgi:quinol monooxygenase YgiN